MSCSQGAGRSQGRATAERGAGGAAGAGAEDEPCGGVVAGGWALGTASSPSWELGRGDRPLPGELRAGGPLVIGCLREACRGDDPQVPVCHSSSGRGWRQRLRREPGRVTWRERVGVPWGCGRDREGTCPPRDGRWRPGQAIRAGLIPGAPGAEPRIGSGVGAGQTPVPPCPHGTIHRHQRPRGRAPGEG